MTDDELIAKFEDGTLAGEDFHHAEHVQLAWAYLARHEFAPALARFSANLKAFASRMGKPDRYDEALTRAWFCVIRDRDRARGGFASWDEFAAVNADLLARHSGSGQRTMVLFNTEEDCFGRKMRGTRRAT
jgi:hypothetical protein